MSAELLFFVLCLILLIISAFRRLLNEIEGCSYIVGFIGNPADMSDELGELLNSVPGTPQ